MRRALIFRDELAAPNGAGTTPSEPQRGTLAGILGLAAAYAIFGRMAFIAAPSNPVVSGIWVPAGIATAALLLGGRRLWPGIWLGSVVVNALTGVPLPGAVAIGAGSAIGTLTGVTLLARDAFDPRFGRVRDAVSFIAFGALAGPLISATIGVTALTLSGASPRGDSPFLWATWWSGDAIGVLTAAPILLLLARRWVESEKRWVEWGALMAALVFVVVLLFRSRQPYIYAVFPLAMVIILRLGRAGAFTTTAIVTALSTWFTIRGAGPFAVNASLTSLFLLQLFVGLLALKGLLLSSALAERREATRRAERRAAQLAEAQELAGFGSWEWEPLTDRLAWSPELGRIYGLAPGEFAGTFDAFLARIHPDDRDRVASIIAGMAESGGPVRFEQRIVRPDGTVRVLESVGRAVFGDNRQLRAEGACLDVTDRRRAELTTRNLNEQLRAVFDASPVAIVHVDREGRVVQWNRGAERTFGWSEAEVVGRPSPAIPAGLADDHLAMIGRALAGEETQSAVRERQRKDGRRIQASVNCAPVRDAAGAMTGAIVTVEDITDRLSMEDELIASRDRLADLSRRLLQAQEGERRKIARGLHDEVGQSLTAIRLELERVRERWPGQSVPAELPQALANLDDVMRSVRDLSLDLRPGVLDDLGLPAAVRWVTKRIASRSGLEASVSTRLGRSAVDPNIRIVCFRILQEALTNVARHASARRVDVVLERADGSIALSVADDGVGFKPDVVRPASGIGLLTMRERAALVSGSVTITSAPGCGTRIQAYFPFAPSRRRPSRAEA